MESITFPRHECGLHLTHNQHRDYYQTVEEYLRDEARISFESGEERALCLELNELWELQWYPDTPIGFYCVGASTLEKCLAFALESEND